jgi:transcription elongation factor Elf1
MSDYIDVKYINLLSAQLEQFKRKDDSTYNFRCPYCGDSQKSKTKARGYVFRREGELFFKCHNCGQGSSIGNLVKFVNPQLYKEYTLERFGNRLERKRVQKTKTDIRLQRKPDYLKNTPLKTLKKVSQLAGDHPVRKYINSRKIPTDQHYRLFYAPKFYKFCNECVPNKFPDIEQDEPRLVIPFIDENQRLIGFQGRAFGKSQPKYITIMLDESAPKIFGLDKVDWSKPVVIVEGPIDSLFLDNAIAMAGADSARFKMDNAVYCYDNEPRSQEIVRRIERTIDNGNPVVIFPNTIKEKDINDMVIGGMDADEIQAIISNNTFNGLMAKAKLSEWRKI